MVRKLVTQNQGALKRMYSWTTQKISNLYSYIKNICVKQKKKPQIQRKLSNKGSYRAYIKEKFHGKKRIQYHSKLRKNFKNFLYQSAQSQVHNDLCCPICIEFLVIPSSTPCGHTFCFECIDQALQFNSQCPVCRQSIRGIDPIPCFMLQKILIKRAQYSMNQATFKKYRQRVQQAKKWKEIRYLNAIKLNIGDQIDVRDTQFIWCLANIVRIYKYQEKVTGLLVHYKGWNSLYDQIIDIKSSRLASPGFFTKRKDLARYNLSQVDNNLRGAVTFGQTQQRNNEISINRQINGFSSDYFPFSLTFVLDNNSSRIFSIGDQNRLSFASQLPDGTRNINLNLFNPGSLFSIESEIQNQPNEIENNQIQQVFNLPQNLAQSSVQLSNLQILNLQSQSQIMFSDVHSDSLIIRHVSNSLQLSQNEQQSQNINQDPLQDSFAQQNESSI